jgi:hypothetical protein
MGVITKVAINRFLGARYLRPGTLCPNPKSLFSSTLGLFENTAIKTSARV